jgi:cytochrome d ubiquinol oxidase subunit I
VVTEVGRQPWIVRNYMRVEDAATANTGVWATFVVVLFVYLGLGVTAILVLRQMSRRWREGEAESEVDEGGPYSPRPTPAPEEPKELVS